MVRKYHILKTNPGHREEEPQNTISENPSGFGELGKKGYLFSGSWRALVFILGEPGSQLIVLGIWGALSKSKKKFRISHLKLKSFHFL